MNITSKGRWKRQVLSLTLSCALLIGSMPVPAFAGEPPVESGGGNDPIITVGEPGSEPGAGTGTPAAEPQPEPQSEPQSEPETQPEPQSEPQSEPEPQPGSQPEPQSEPQSEPETQPETQPGSQPQPEPEPEENQLPDAGPYSLIGARIIEANGNFKPWRSWIGDVEKRLPKNQEFTEIKLYQSITYPSGDEEPGLPKFKPEDFLNALPVGVELGFLPMENETVDTAGGFLPLDTTGATVSFEQSILDEDSVLVNDYMDIVKISRAVFPANVPRPSSGHYRLVLVDARMPEAVEIYSAYGGLRLLDYESWGESGGPVIHSGAILPGGSVDVPYRFQLKAAPGVAGNALAWSVEEGDGLPGWLALDTDTGLLSGTPIEKGAYTFSLKVTEADSSGAEAGSDRRRFTINVSSAQIRSANLQLSLNAAGKIYGGSNVNGMVYLDNPPDGAVVTASMYRNGSGEASPGAVALEGEGGIRYLNCRLPGGTESLDKVVFTLESGEEGGRPLDAAEKTVGKEALPVLRLMSRDDALDCSTYGIFPKDNPESPVASSGFYHDNPPQIGSLEPGAYILRFERSPYPPLEREVSLAQGDDKTIDLTGAPRYVRPKVTLRYDGQNYSGSFLQDWYLPDGAKLGRGAVCLEAGQEVILRLTPNYQYPELKNCDLSDVSWTVAQNGILDYTLPSLPSGTVSGRLKYPDGRMAGYIPVSILAPRGGFTYVASNYVGGDGSFRIEGLRAGDVLRFKASGFAPFEVRLAQEQIGSGSLGVLEIPDQYAAIAFTLLCRDSGPQGPGAASASPWYSYEYTAESGGQAVAISAGAGCVCILDPGQIVDNALKLVISPKNKTAAAQTIHVALDDKLYADIGQISFTNNGRIAFPKIPARFQGRAHIFCKKGYKVGEVIVSPAYSRSSSYLSDGEYTVLYTRDNNYTGRYARLEDLRDRLKEAGCAYLEQAVNVSRGHYTAAPQANIPDMDLKKLTILNLDLSSISAANEYPGHSVVTAILDVSSTIRLDDYIDISIANTGGSHARGISANGKRVDIPAGTHFNLKPSEYGGYPLTIRYLVDTGTANQRSTLQAMFRIGGSSVKETLGTAVCSLERSRLSLPNYTGSQTFTVSGVLKDAGSGAQAEVRIYDGDTLIGSALPDRFGRWRSQVTLAEPDEWSSHTITARAYGSDGILLDDSASAKTIIFSRKITTLASVKEVAFSGKELYPGWNLSIPVYFNNRNGGIVAAYEISFSEGGMGVENDAVFFRYETGGFRHSKQAQKINDTTYRVELDYAKTAPFRFNVEYWPVMPEGCVLTQEQGGQMEEVWESYVEGLRKQVEAHPIPDSQDDPKGYLDRVNELILGDNDSMRITAHRSSAQFDQESGKLSGLSFYTSTSTSTGEGTVRLNLGGEDRYLAEAEKEALIAEYEGKLGGKSFYAAGDLTDIIIKFTETGKEVYIRAATQGQTAVAYVLDGETGLFSVTRAGEIAAPDPSFALLRGVGAANSQYPAPSAGTWITLGSGLGGMIPGAGKIAAGTGTISTGYSIYSDIQTGDCYKTTITRIQDMPQSEVDRLNREIERAQVMSKILNGLNLLLGGRNYIASEAVAAGAAAGPAGVAGVVLVNVKLTAGATAISYFNDVVQHRVKQDVEVSIQKYTTISSSGSAADCDPPDPDNGYDNNITYDPSGYVYEAVRDNRLEGVTATLYEKQGDTEDGLQWADPDGQENPQTTNEEGCYGWFVPTGNWKVLWEKEGYESADSAADPAARANAFNVQNWTPGWLPVLPIQLEVNKGLVSLEAPVVSGVETYSDVCVVTFSKYMKTDSEALDAFAVYNALGEAMEIAVVPDGEPGDISAPILAKTFLLEGGFEEGVTLAISNSIASYAGVPLAESVLRPIAVTSKPDVAMPRATPDGSQDLAPGIRVSLEAEGGAKIFCKSPGLDSFVKYTDPIFFTSDGDLEAYAELPGAGRSQILHISYRVPAVNTVSSGIPEEVKPSPDPDPGSSGGGGGGGGSAGKPTVVGGEGGVLALSPDGKTLVITPEAGWRIKDVVLNGDSKGAVTALAELKSTDKVEVYFERIPAEPWANPFIDVTQSDWYYEAVKYVHQNGLFAGVGAHSFHPGGIMTRAMLVTALHKMEGGPEPEGRNPFADVQGGQWYAKAVAWAWEESMASGYGNGLFGPDDSVTREQAACILYQYAKAKGFHTSAKGDLSRFSDSGKASPWAVEALRWAVGAGLISGKGGGILDPGGNATRAEAASILRKLRESKPKAEK